MSPADVLELVRWLQAVVALLAVQAPVLVWIACALWKLDRRLVRVEAELGIEGEGVTP